MYRQWCQSFFFFFRSIIILSFGVISLDALGCCLRFRSVYICEVHFLFHKCLTMQENCILHIVWSFSFSLTANLIQSNMSAFASHCHLPYSDRKYERKWSEESYVLEKTNFTYIFLDTFANSYIQSGSGFKLFIILMCIFWESKPWPWHSAIVLYEIRTRQNINRHLFLNKSLWKIFNMYLLVLHN